MKLLISGVCGFVGSTLAQSLLELDPTLQTTGFDNYIRPGSYSNIETLRRRGLELFHCDIRSATDISTLPQVDWIIDAAANASVLAGVDGTTSSRQLLEHNLFGTVNLLEKAKHDRAGFILLSTSRVYSIAPLAALKVHVENKAYHLTANEPLPPGLSLRGIDESFSTAAPVSLYGATKLASEQLALEYGEAFGFPVWVNRCGVMAGAGQFGRPDQGIFAYWLNAWLHRRPLHYTGFGGTGHQVRDCFHPRDIASLLLRQMTAGKANKPRVINLGGGAAHAISLAQLSEWCSARFGPHEVNRDSSARPFDLPWVVIDSELARQQWDWRPLTSLEAILEEIAAHAEANPQWLALSGVV